MDQEPAAPSPPDDAQAVAQLSAAYKRLQQETARVIVGQEEVVEQLVMCLFARGHAILEGAPGTAKSLIISTLARGLQLKFARIQFTPDLMPGDITGTEVIQEDKATGQRTFRFLEGPIFANVVLAGEINRTPPKTQSALLEAMQERQVSAGGRRHPMPDPFFVLATQVSLEQEGTYPMPEAQQDRFMFKILVRYPRWDEELRIIDQTTSDQTPEAETVLDRETLLRLQRLVRRIPVADHTIAYAMKLVRATRVGEPGVPDFIREYVSCGAGPRACQYLILGGKARAALHGRCHVSTEDIAAVPRPVLRHRILTNFVADADGMSSDQLVERLLKEIPAQGGSAAVPGEYLKLLRA